MNSTSIHICIIKSIYFITRHISQELQYIQNKCVKFFPVCTVKTNSMYNSFLSKGVILLFIFWIFLIGRMTVGVFDLVQFYGVLYLNITNLNLNLKRYYVDYIACIFLINVCVCVTCFVCVFVL